MKKIKKVLVFPNALQIQSFLSLLRYAKKTLGWEITILAEYGRNRLYQDLLSSSEGIIALPEFSKKMPWESNPEENEKITAFIQQCESMVGAPASSAILSGERDIGRAFSNELYYWEERSLARSVLKDNTLPFECLKRMFKFLNDAIDRCQPDLIIGGAKSSSLGVALHYISIGRGVPFVVRHNCKLLSDRYYWTLDRKMFNTQAEWTYLEKQKAESPISEASKKYLFEFREKPKVINYIQKRMSKKSNIFRSYYMLGLRILNWLVYYSKGVKGKAPKPVWSKFLEIHRMPYLKWKQSRYYASFSEKALSEFKYIYFPLHKQPELILNLQGQTWYDQKHLVRLLSANLPAGYKLLVRENCRNAGIRHTRYLKELMSYPGVVLVDPFDSQFKYIQAADLVITDNGSTGWESLVLRKPLLVLDRVFYGMPDSINRVKDITQLGESIMEALHLAQQHPEHDARLGRRLDAERETTLPDSASPEQDLLFIKEVLTREAQSEAKALLC